MIHNGAGQGVWKLPTRSHQRFRELCALSVANELSTEERNRLAEHLAHCEACRELKEQYEQVVNSVISGLAPGGQETGDEAATDSWSLVEAEDRLMKSLPLKPDRASRRAPVAPKRGRLWDVPRYAVAALILLVSSAGAYWFGAIEGRRSPIRASSMPNIAASPQEREVPAPRSMSARVMPESAQNPKMREELWRSQLEIFGLKDRVRELEAQSVAQKAELDRAQQERDGLNRELATALASSRDLETRLNLAGARLPGDTAKSQAFQAQIQSLNSAIEDKDQQIARQQELLQHDRDIRDLIGARGLYIAEIYDVAKNGDTQKPFGRVFYTKDKSLVFYGYDLDRQKGLKRDVVFQAWGREGSGENHAVSLGLLYQDDANQKRWVLKFSDRKTISEIDAVFITVEPEGGSEKPSGKPLLFTYLRLDPNHP